MPQGTQQPRVLFAHNNQSVLNEPHVAWTQPEHDLDAQATQACKVDSAVFRD